MPATLPNGLSYLIEIAFPSSATWGNSFILDNPMRGKLNDITYTLGGSVWADVSSDVIAVSVNRGRSTDTDLFQSGSCIIQLRNDSRQYDPLNTAGTYYGGIVPRLPVRVTAGGVRLFSGYIYDMNFDYDKPSTTRDISIMDITCTDAFSILAEQQLTAYTPSQQGSGARVSEVLNRSEVAFPSTRNISTGSSTLGTQTVDDGTNVLDYLQEVTASEQGFLFVSGDGLLTFLGRNDVVSTSPSMTFSDDGTGTPYQTFQMDYGSELLFNRVVVSRNGGSTYIKTNTASIADYLTKTLTLGDLLVSTDAQAETIADSLVTRYSQPEVRFSEVSTVIESGAGKFLNVLNLELGDVVTVKKAFRTGAPSSISRTCLVQGLTHSISPSVHRVVVDLGAVDNRAFLRLDNTTFGILDTNRLGY